MSHFRGRVHCNRERMRSGRVYAAFSSMLHRASPSQISRKVSFAIRSLFFNNADYTTFSTKVEVILYWVSLVRGSFLASTKANPHEGYAVFFRPFPTRARGRWSRRSA